METKESFMETKGFNETSPEAIKEEIRMIYRKFNPKKLESLPQIFKKYEGREEVLLQDVRSKYTAFNDPDGDLYDKIVEGLKSIYFKKIKPLEEMYQFDEFHSPFLENADFEANPTVLLLGQYSTGKTSFIKWMVNREFPGQRVGPEPTTDRFSAVMHGAEDRIIPGNAAVMASDKPFRPLKIFGTTFMNKFEVSTMNVPALERLTFIDTPGVLSGEKQRIGRSYDFTTVVKWFAEKADRILLLFDAHKLDISDEFKRTIEVLKRHDDKVRVILNKSDSIDEQQLIRVYGAMMWSLGKVYQTPEVLRVYVGSFWDKPYREGSNTSLFTAEKNDLLADLNSLPRNSSIRKINELVKRIRMLIVHVHIIDHMRDNMPSMFGKSKAQKKLIDNLGDEFHKIHKITKLPVGDFPAVREYQSKLATLDFGKLPKRKAKLFHTVERTLEEDIPALMKELPKNDDYSDTKTDSSGNPFGDATTDNGLSWVVSTAEKAAYDNEFNVAMNNMSDARMSGDQAKRTMMKSQLPVQTLRKIWTLADIDQDGHLDIEEFAVCKWLIQIAKSGDTVPDELPANAIPPSKRQVVQNNAIPF